MYCYLQIVFQSWQNKSDMRVYNKQIIDMNAGNQFIINHIIQ